MMTRWYGRLVAVLIFLGFVCLLQSACMKSKPATAADPVVTSSLIASDFPDLQAAVDALPRQQGEIDLPPGKYVLKKTLNLTGGPGYHLGLKLVGSGPATIIEADTPGQPAIDMTGNSGCVF